MPTDEKFKDIKLEKKFSSNLNGSTFDGLLLSFTNTSGLTVHITLNEKILKDDSQPKDENERINLLKGNNFYVKEIAIVNNGAETKNTPYEPGSLPYLVVTGDKEKKNLTVKVGSGKWFWVTNNLLWTSLIIVVLVVVIVFLVWLVWAFCLSEKE